MLSGCPDGHNHHPSQRRPIFYNRHVPTIYLSRTHTILVIQDAERMSSPAQLYLAGHINLCRHRGECVCVREMGASECLVTSLLLSSASFLKTPARVLRNHNTRASRHHLKRPALLLFVVSSPASSQLFQLQEAVRQLLYKVHDNRVLPSSAPASHFSRPSVLQYQVFINSVPRLPQKMCRTAFCYAIPRLRVYSFLMLNAATWL